MAELFGSIAHIGVHAQQTEGERHRTILTNRLAVSALLIFSLICSTELYKHTQVDGQLDLAFVRFPVLMSLSVLSLLANHFQLLHVSRVLLLLGMPFFLLLFPTLLGFTHNEYFFWYPYAAIGFSVAPYFMFDISKDRGWLLSVLGFYLLLNLGIDSLLMHMGQRTVEVLPIVLDNYFYYKLSSLIIFLFINASLFYSFSLNQRYGQQLLAQNELLKNNTETLAEQNTRLAEVNATKDRFFRIIGHDLRNPFGTIFSFLEMLEMQYERFSRERVLQIIGTLKHISTQGNRLLEELLEWSRTQNGSMPFEPMPLDLHQTTQEVIEMLQQNAQIKRITLHNLIPPGSELVADSHMLQTILRNLLANSIKFTPHHGKVVVDVQLDPNYVQLQVRDTGVGIPPEDLDRLFQPNISISNPGTDNETGTGLGLILCREFVQKHQGRIWAENRAEGGSVFRFTLSTQLSAHTN